MMKLRKDNFFYGTVGVLGLFGVAFIVQNMDNLLTPIIGRELVALASIPVIVWGGLVSFLVTYRALKGGFK